MKLSHHVREEIIVRLVQSQVFILMTTCDPG
jgi:hypothetical protein